MAKVEIITRALNRLEYTALCIRGVDKYAGVDDYRHIIINQASTDGTGQWLNSLIQEKHYKLKVLNNAVNSGDAGGMKDGFDLIDEDCEYIMQFDNDCTPLTPDFLKILVEVMDSRPDVGAIMMKRENVVNVLVPTSAEEIDGRTYGDIRFGTCCMILRRKTLDEYNQWATGQKIGWGKAITHRLIADGHKVWKAVDLRVDHIDGSAGQVKKYPSYFGGKKGNNGWSNFTRINYSKREA